MVERDKDTISILGTVRWLTTLIVVVGVFEGLIQANVQRLAEDKGWDKYLVTWWGPSMNFLASIMAHPWAWPIVYYAAGVASALWLIKIFPIPRREKEVSIPPTDLHSAPPSPSSIVPLPISRPAVIKMTAFEKQQRQKVLTHLLAFLDEFAKKPCFSDQKSWQEMMRTGGRKNLEDGITKFYADVRTANSELAAEFRKCRDEFPDIAALAKPSEIQERRMGPQHRKNRYFEFDRIFATSPDAHNLLLQRSDTVKQYAADLLSAKKWVEDMRRVVVAKRRSTDETPVYD